jgi:hypothetical protein
MDRKDRTGWADYLPLVQRIVNQHRSKATGFTPHQVMFGVESTLSRGLTTTWQQQSLSRTDAPITPKSTEWFTKQTENRRQVCASVARVNKSHIDARHRRAKNIPDSVFSSGDIVMMTYPKNAKPKGKIGPVWRGPYEVLRRKESLDPTIKSNVYFVQHCATGAEVKVSDSTLVTYDASRSDPRVVASTDNNEWVVEQIIEHRFDPPLAVGARSNTVAARKNLEFLCRWLNFGPADDDWISYRGNKDLEAITAYAADHPELGLD